MGILNILKKVAEVTLEQGQKSANRAIQNTNRKVQSYERRVKTDEQRQKLDEIKNKIPTSYTPKSSTRKTNEDEDDD